MYFKSFWLWTTLINLSPFAETEKSPFHKMLRSCHHERRRTGNRRSKRSRPLSGKRCVLGLGLTVKKKPLSWQLLSPHCCAEFELLNWLSHACKCFKFTSLFLLRKGDHWMCRRHSGQNEEKLLGISSCFRWSWSYCRYWCYFWDSGHDRCSAGTVCLPQVQKTCSVSLCGTWRRSKGTRRSWQPVTARRCTTNTPWDGAVTTCPPSQTNLQMLTSKPYICMLE